MRFYGKDIGHFYELNKNNSDCMIESALKVLPKKQKVGIFGKIATLNWVK